MAELNKAQLDKLLKDTAIASLNLGVATNIGEYTYAIPVEYEGETFYVKASFTAAARKATKVNPAFNLDEAVEKYEITLAQRAEKAAAAEAKKAEKLAKAKKD